MLYQILLENFESVFLTQRIRLWGHSMIRSRFAILGLSVLSACATVPDTVVRYYPPKAKLVVTVTQAVDCNADKSALIASNSVSDAVTYSADTGVEPRTFRTKAPTDKLSDTNLTFNLTDDGRLKSVNGDSTGQAEAITKAVITAAVAAVGLIGGAAPPSPPPGQLAECGIIDKWGGGKPVTLTYSQDVTFASGSAQGPFTMQPDPASAGLYTKIKTKLPTLTLTVGTAAPMAEPVVLSQGAKAGPKLVLNRTGTVHLALADGATSGWAGDIVIPLTSTFDVPLPQAAPFGKVNFALTLADSGAITTLTYGHLAAGAGPANVAAAAATAAKPSSAADRAAELKAEADEIAQNARVVRCRTDPTNCT